VIIGLGKKLNAKWSVQFSDMAEVGGFGYGEVGQNL
jgi:hypothetical protein